MLRTHALLDGWFPVRHSLRSGRRCIAGCVFCPASRPGDAGAARPLEAHILRARLEEIRPGQRIGIGAGLEEAWFPGADRSARGHLELLHEHGFSAWILTRSDGVVRDLGLLGRMVPRPVIVFSFMAADDPGGLAWEGDCPPTSRRMAALSACREAGLTTGLFLSPVDLARDDHEDHARMLLDEAMRRGAAFAMADFMKPAPSADGAMSGEKRARFERAFQQEAVDRGMGIRCPWSVAKEGLGERDTAVLALNHAWACLKFLGKTRQALADAALAINWMEEAAYAERLQRGNLTEIRGVGPWIQNLLAALHEGEDKQVRELEAEVKGQKKPIG